MLKDLHTLRVRQIFWSFAIFWFENPADKKVWSREADPKKASNWWSAYGFPPLIRGSS